ncbi:MAG: hypothetical protein H0X47_15095 [Nitrospirales bacterium]|nr:hypothetical protein [Nitrospirales bacterium]
MLFQNEDPIAIHTLCMAAFRILRDLAEKGGDNYIHEVVKAIIKPGMEKEFWSVLQGPANFFKHADRDADAILVNVDEGVNDIAMLLTCLYYQNLGHQLTPEMMVLMLWVNVMHPNYLPEDIQALLKDQLSQARIGLIGQSRRDQLSVCRQLLQDFQNLTG